MVRRPLFVTLGLLVVVSQGVWASDSDLSIVPVSFSFRMAGEAVEQSGVEPQAAVGAILDYNVYKTYSIGVDFAYFRPFNQFDAEAMNGIDDLGFYLMDSTLWQDVDENLKLSTKVEFILPTSSPSKDASMNYGVMENLALRKGWTGRFSTTYVLSANEYDYQYRQAEDDAGGTVYNIRFSLQNKLIFAYDFWRDYHYMFSGSVITYNDFNNATYDIFLFSTGFSYDIQKNTSIDFGVKCGLKEAGTPDPWNGPNTSAALFGDSGTIFYVGTTIHI